MAMLSFADSERNQKLRELQPDVDMHSAVRLIKVKSMGPNTRALRHTTRGLDAARKLLAGAQQIATKSKKFRSYIKDGNLETALADFNSVDPVLSKDPMPRPGVGKFYAWNALSRHKYENSLVGSVGDKRLFLRMAGDNYSSLPVLEIRSALDTLYDRIVYKTIRN